MTCRGSSNGLKHFRHRRHEVIVFHILDPAELEFPFRDTTLFKGLEGLPEILTDPHALKRAYQAGDRVLLERARSAAAGRWTSTTSPCVPTRTSTSRCRAIWRRDRLVIR